jgi:hypothetical protein
MGQRRVLLAIAALVAAISLVVAACGGSQPEQKGTDNEEIAPPEAQDVIIKAMETMFTWSPFRDASPLDGYTRALPYLGGELRNFKIELGNSVWVEEWKQAKLDVTAHALLVPGEHPEDTPDTVERAVMLTVMLTAPDGKQVFSGTMRVERIVAKRGPEGWRVEDVSFFPENEFSTQRQVCPPGQSHQPPPDGPCVTIPPPPAKQCPDGATVPPDQVCPPPQTGPQTEQCPDGTSIPAGGTCPRRRRPKNARVGRRRRPTNPAHPRPGPTDRHPTPTEPANVPPGQCKTADVPSSRRGFGTRNNRVLASHSQ